MCILKNIRFIYTVPFSGLWASVFRFSTFFAFSLLNFDTDDEEGMEAYTWTFPFLQFLPFSTFSNVSLPPFLSLSSRAKKTRKRIYGIVARTHSGNQTR